MSTTEKNAKVMIFKQKNKKAAQAKMKRLVGNSSYGTIGFCNFQLIKDFSEYISEEELKENPYIKDYFEHNNQYDWSIQGTSTYHSDSTIERMYKTNGNDW